MKKTRKITVNLLYTGMGDYWGGNGRRWDDDAGCLFATYGPDTTMQDLVNDWVNDFNTGGDCDSFPEDIYSEDIRQAILKECLNDKGRADYKANNLLGWISHEDFGDEDDDFMEYPQAIILVEIENEDE